jgi:hypothetical protein
MANGKIKDIRGLQPVFTYCYSHRGSITGVVSLEEMLK